MDISTGTLPEVGFQTSKVGETSPTPTSKSNMDAPHIYSSKAVHKHLFLIKSVVHTVLFVDMLLQYLSAQNTEEWIVIELKKANSDVTLFPPPTSKVNRHRQGDQTQISEIIQFS